MDKPVKTPITDTFRCPFCRAKVGIYTTTCPTCKTDVSLLSNIKLLPYNLYNKALVDMDNNAPWQALPKLCTAIELNNKFSAARIQLHKLTTELGLPTLADYFDMKSDTSQNKSDDQQ